jgi:hypothetical protein
VSASNIERQIERKADALIGSKLCSWQKLTHDNHEMQALRHTQALGRLEALRHNTHQSRDDHATIMRRSCDDRAHRLTSKRERPAGDAARSVARTLGLTLRLSVLSLVVAECVSRATDRTSASKAHAHTHTYARVVIVVEVARDRDLLLGELAAREHGRDEITATTTRGRGWSLRGCGGLVQNRRCVCSERRARMTRRSATT